MKRSSSGPRPASLLIVYFIVQSIFSPAIFIVFFILGPSVGDALGIDALHDLGTNTSRLNLAFFLPSALMLNAAFYMANFAFAAQFVSDLSLQRFCTARFTYWSIIPLAFGGLHLGIWSDEMEGNIFGFIFLLPLLAMAFYQFVFFCVQNVRLIRLGAAG